jgi:hypothetical protein
MQQNGVFTSRNVDFSSKDGDLSDLFYIYLHIIYICIAEMDISTCAGIGDKNPHVAP